MVKSVTLKDVLYAMEFGGEELIGRQGRSGFTWSLSRSGAAVDRHIVDQARSIAGVVSLASGPGSSRLGWRRTA